MSKIKVYIPHRTNLNEKMLKEQFDTVDNSNEADVIIAQSTLAPDFNNEFKKTIYIAIEPPLADHRHFCYSHFDDFLLVVTHNKNPKKDNQWFFTDTDEPQYYPTNPVPSSIPQYTREDTTIKNRGIFYAGMVGPYESQPNLYGGINITPLRRRLCDWIRMSMPGSKVIGIGHNGQQTKVSDWRLDKSEQIKQSNCDFVLALENTILPNYLYEKIWDGFASDRVTLYLGDPNVHKHIPTNCFIDIRQYYDAMSDSFDFEQLKIRLNSISQFQYDEILKNAREFRKTANGRYVELQDKLTEKIINFINEL